MIDIRLRESGTPRGHVSLAERRGLGPYARWVAQQVDSDFASRPAPSPRICACGCRAAFTPRSSKGVRQVYATPECGSRVARARRAKGRKLGEVTGV